MLLLLLSVPVQSRYFDDEIKNPRKLLFVVVVVVVCLFVCLFVCLPGRVFDVLMRFIVIPAYAATAVSVTCSFSLDM